MHPHALYDTYRLPRSRVSVPATRQLALQPEGKRTWTQEIRQQSNSFLVFTTPISARPEYIRLVLPRAAPQEEGEPAEEPVAANKTKEFGYNKESHPLLRAMPPLPFVLTRDFDMITQ